jgi:hypothetical protein
MALPIGAQLAGATHLLTSWDKLPMWFPFVAGFARGRSCPLVYVGPPLECKPGYVPDIVICNDDAELVRYFKSEIKASSERETFDKARTTLLDMGIPFTPESFANCVREGNPEAVRLFLDAHFSPNETDKNGVPALCIAARAGKYDVITMLLVAKADVNQKSADRGNTALVDAALGKHTNIAADLIASGADVNARSKDGQSALIISVGLSDAATVELLLKAGARADDPDMLGATARKYAALFHKDEIIALFDKYAPVSAAV